MPEAGEQGNILKPNPKMLRYFELQEGTSSKFWEISLNVNTITTRYGKIGAGAGIYYSFLWISLSRSSSVTDGFLNRTEEGSIFSFFNSRTILYPVA